MNKVGVTPSAAGLHTDTFLPQFETYEILRLTASDKQQLTHSWHLFVQMALDVNSRVSDRSVAAHTFCINVRLFGANSGLNLGDLRVRPISRRAAQFSRSI